MDIRSKVILLFSFGYVVIAYTPVGYLGCYLEHHIKLLQGDKSFSFTNTGDECKTYCFVRGFEYAGTENAIECYCGHTMTHNSKMSGCDQSCPGNSNEMCGNIWRISVYKTGFSAPTTISATMVTTHTLGSSTHTVADMMSSINAFTNVEPSPKSVSYVGSGVTSISAEAKSTVVTSNYAAKVSAPTTISATMVTTHTLGSSTPTVADRMSSINAFTNVESRPKSVSYVGSGVTSISAEAKSTVVTSNYAAKVSTTTKTTRSLTTTRSTRTTFPDRETSSASFSAKRPRTTSVPTRSTPTVNLSHYTANGGNKWKSWSGSRIFYLVRNVTFEFSQCKSFCELSVKSSLAVFWDTINPWFEESGILERGKRYWVQKKEPMLHGNQCHYLSALGYPRGLHCTEKYTKQDECKKETSYKRLVLQSSPCTEGYGCICQRRI